MTLNDQSFVECAEALADRMAKSGDTLRAQLEHGFLLATCRPATATELDDLERFAKNMPADRNQAARLKMVASVLLNLDEVISK